MIDFEWDPDKARTNFRKHGIAFSEAASVLKDPLGITVYDPDHSEGENRFLTVGTSMRGQPLIVSHTARGTKIRIISARKLNRMERKAYENEIQRRGKD